MQNAECRILSKALVPVVIAGGLQGGGSKVRILVGQGSCGNAAGATKVYEVLEAGLRDNGIDAKLLSTGCIGACYLEPIVEVIGDGGEKCTYVKVNADTAVEIIQKHLLGGTPVEELLMPD